jgi:serine/threonine protein kinase
MQPPTWTQIKELFHAAVELSPPERAVLLQAAGPADSELIHQVTALLSAHDASGDFIARPAVVDAGLVPAVLPSGSTETLIGETIGSYQIVSELGRGGMGAVYLAVRADRSFDRQVALKLIKRGMDSDAIVTRFVMERQILANLDHPNIAGLIDGGTTESGLPYFVMEYIEGQSIARYCDEGRLDVTQRLKLFQQVCEAVQFAHQNLIIHRDLKPSNIIVTVEGIPKLLDFGIAKILDPERSQENVEATVTQLRALTPDYASPEQLRGVTITTASDVYSLGVILYELLTGSRPFGRKRSTPEEVLRLIDAAEPLRPSLALARAETAEHDGEGRPVREMPEGSADKLRRRLAGDLDNILLKALRREPERRYASARDLSEDIRRHLEGRPVLARPDTLGYRTAKFVRRNKAAVAAAMIVALTLLSATVITSWQARVARRERAKAEQRYKDVRTLTNSFLFDFYDSIADLNGATKAREMVVKEAQEYLDRMAQEAGDDRELLWELSTAYLKLGDVQGQPGFSRTGDTAAAMVSYEKSLAARRRLALLEPNHAEYELGLAITLSRFGPLYQVLGRPDAAAEKMREALAITDRLVPNTSDWATYQAATRNAAFLGDALSESGDYAGALAMYQKCLSTAEQYRGSFPDPAVKHRFAVCRERLGFIYTRTGEWQRSLDNHQAMLEIETELSALDPANGEYSRAKATALDHVGEAYRGLKDYPKALESGKLGLAVYEDFLAREPQNARTQKDVGDGSHHVAETMLAAGDYRGALALLQRTVSIRRGLVSLDQTNVEYPDDLADSLILLGECQAAGGNFAKAVEALQEARAICEPIATSYPHRPDYRRQLARLYSDLGDDLSALKNPSEATGWYQKSLTLWNELQDQHALWANEVDRPKEMAAALARVQASAN